MAKSRAKVRSPEICLTCVWRRAGPRQGALRSVLPVYGKEQGQGKEPWGLSYLYMAKSRAKVRSPEICLTCVWRRAGPRQRRSSLRPTGCPWAGSVCLVPHSCSWPRQGTAPPGSPAPGRPAHSGSWPATAPPTNPLVTFKLGSQLKTNPLIQTHSLCSIWVHS